MKRASPEMTGLSVAPTPMVAADGTPPCPATDGQDAVVGLKLAASGFCAMRKLWTVSRSQSTRVGLIMKVLPSATVCRNASGPLDEAIGEKAEPLARKTTCSPV